MSATTKLAALAVDGHWQRKVEAVLDHVSSGKLTAKTLQSLVELRLIGRHAPWAPNGTAVRARIESFTFTPEVPIGKGKRKKEVISWPYAADPNWKCTAEKIALTGMYYNPPNTNENDYAVCQYCQLGLAGWESSDDPVLEHSKRSPECIMFKGPKLISEMDPKILTKLEAEVELLDNLSDSIPDANDCATIEFIDSNKTNGVSSKSLKISLKYDDTTTSKTLNQSIRRAPTRKKAKLDYDKYQEEDELEANEELDNNAKFSDETVVQCAAEKSKVSTEEPVHLKNLVDDFEDILAPSTTATKKKITGKRTIFVKSGTQIDDEEIGKQSTIKTRKTTRSAAVAAATAVAKSNVVVVAEQLTIPEIDSEPDDGVINEKLPVKIRIRTAEKRAVDENGQDAISDDANGRSNTIKRAKIAASSSATQKTVPLKKRTAAIIALEATDQKITTSSVKLLSRRLAEVDTNSGQDIKKPASIINSLALNDADPKSPTFRIENSDEDFVFEKAQPKKTATKRSKVTAKKLITGKDSDENGDNNDSRKKHDFIIKKIEAQLQSVNTGSFTNSSSDSKIETNSKINQQSKVTISPKKKQTIVAKAGKSTVATKKYVITSNADDDLTEHEIAKPIRANINKGKKEKIASEPVLVPTLTVLPVPAPVFPLVAAPRAKRVIAKKTIHPPASKSNSTKSQTSKAVNPTVIVSKDYDSDTDDIFYEPPTEIASQAELIHEEQLQDMNHAVIENLSSNQTQCEKGVGAVLAPIKSKQVFSNMLLDLDMVMSEATIVSKANGSSGEINVGSSSIENEKKARWSSNSDLLDCYSDANSVFEEERNLEKPKTAVLNDTDANFEEEFTNGERIIKLSRPDGVLDFLKQLTGDPAKFVQSVDELSEEEKDGLTVEQYLQRLIDGEVKRIREKSQKMIELTKAEGDKVKKLIEAKGL
ncbi:hypothetical protein HK100_009555 [Physocladia obscura]|uniref:Uncharacterized protein n=1 Tax=Physocladia obscura TaxID=109957 RepID=A0AAD5T5Z2_9FUNG|nr:hypothetical protein HK100_009555 [Physocladia obscura]